MLQCLFFFCFLAPMPPAPAVPDGAGGFVPFTNSRVMPDGSLRPYDPSIDGVMGPDGRVYFPEPPAPYPPPQGRVTIGPPMPELAPRAPSAARRLGCYGPNGAPIQPAPPDCQTRSAPPMTSGPGPDRERPP
jgi:hypothetical protein